MTHEPNFVFTTIRAEMAARLARKAAAKAPQPAPVVVNIKAPKK